MARTRSRVQEAALHRRVAFYALVGAALLAGVCPSLAQSPGCKNVNGATTTCTPQSCPTKDIGGNFKDGEVITAKMESAATPYLMKSWELFVPGAGTQTKQFPGPGSIISGTVRAAAGKDKTAAFAGAVHLTMTPNRDVKYTVKDPDPQVVTFSCR
jgi:hypothetical protein